jgi:hypothetical protein
MIFEDEVRVERLGFHSTHAIVGTIGNRLETIGTSRDRQLQKSRLQHRANYICHK